MGMEICEIVSVVVYPCVFPVVPFFFKGMLGGILLNNNKMYTVGGTIPALMPGFLALSVENQKISNYL